MSELEGIDRPFFNYVKVWPLQLILVMPYVRRNK